MMKHYYQTFFLLLLVLCASAQVAPVFDPPAERMTFPAVEITHSLAIDGRLDEDAWQRASPASGFVQQNPNQGQPASSPTYVRILYNQEYLYIGASCQTGSLQPQTVRVQNMARDFDFELNELFGVSIDGFLDGRNAVSFQTSPYGAQRDLQVIDSETFNLEWDALWFVRTQRTDSGWTAEFAIPWKTLRYPAEATQLGIIFLRNIRHLNENVTMPAVPRLFTPYRMAYEGLVTGLRLPKPSANIQTNPYLVYEADRTQQGEEPAQTAVKPKLGGEVKWAVTPNTVLDLTVNTDFAQADADRQVVNLSRFSVLFPERRQFFLEGANLFNASMDDFILPFFSRRIGLDETGNRLPLDAGLRLTHQDSKRSYGGLLVRQRASDQSPLSYFGVGRYSQNVGQQSRLGGMITYRHDGAYTADDATRASNQNVTATVDGLLRPSQRVNIGFMASGSQDTRLGNGLAAQGWVAYQNNLLYVGLMEFFVKNYQPGIGLERFGRDYVMTSPAIDFDIRPRWLPRWLRKIEPDASAYIFSDPITGRLIGAEGRIAPLDILFQSGANLEVSFEPNVQILDSPDNFVGVTVAPGYYRFVRTLISANTDFSRRLAVSGNFATGAYYDGQLTSWRFKGRLAPLPHLELTVDYEYNRFRDLGILQQRFDTHLFGLNGRVALNPRLQLIGFYQRNTAVQRNVYNVRLAWEYRPLSYLYVVFNENLNQPGQPADHFRQQQLIGKLTFLRQL